MTKPLDNLCLDIGLASPPKPSIPEVLEEQAAEAAREAHPDGVTSTMIAEAVAEARKAWYPKSNQRALHDFNLPAIVRGYIAINQGPATETCAIEEAGFMPHLYAKYNGRDCQVTLVSAMDDIGISWTERLDNCGYNERLSIYDLTDFTTVSPFMPVRKRSIQKGTLREVILRVLRNHKMTNMADEDGQGYPLVDLMSNPAPCDISTGIEQMSYLADDIACAVEDREVESKAGRCNEMRMLTTQEKADGSWRQALFPTTKRARRRNGARTRP